MSDRDDQIRGIVLWFWLLNPLEILASEAGHFGGYLVVPQPSGGLLEPYYFVCCQLDRKRCVMILPRVRDRQTIICSVPEPGAFQPLIQVAVEAGIAIQETNAQVGLLCGSVAAERVEEVAALLAKKATFLCATNREVVYDLH